MHISSFAALLKDVVNINQSRLDELQVNVDAVYDALAAAADIGGAVVRYIPQGSWPHKTIIKPIDDNEFDADILVEFASYEDWDQRPVAYLDGLEGALVGHGTYGDMVDEADHSRCIRVIYANQHHLDIVAYRILDDGRKVIVNRDTQDWEDTDPEGFTEWIRTKDQISDRNFRKVIRLLKYLRDYHGVFEGTPSIILTALAGRQVSSARKAADPGYYANVPTALRNIVADLNTYLQANPTVPTIEDPSGAAHPDGIPVTFDHRWDQATYDTLRVSISDLAVAIDAAYLEPDSDHSVELWQAIFGHGFKGPEPKKSKKTVLPPPATGASHRKGHGG
jgi:hypothetical protein